jgi:hypothetical protein
LLVNESKTEYTHLGRHLDRIAEEWRRTKKLGSLLGDDEDVARRIQHATIAFQRLWAIWLRGACIDEHRRVKLYNAFVLPVLCYNSGTWALTKAKLHHLEAFHRRQLRRVVGVIYPNKIHNCLLYERTGTRPLGSMLLDSRWRLFGHLLRLPENTPPNVAMRAYFTNVPQHRGWPGRPRTTLPRVLHDDLSSVGLRLSRLEDLTSLRLTAHSRQAWQELSKKIAVAH